MSDLLNKGREILNGQPFSSLLGAELHNLSEGYAELALPIRPDFTQNHGFVHGGVLSYLADNCLTFAAATILGNCVTSEYKINYLRPALGELLIAKATVVSSGKRQAVCDCRLFAIDGAQEKLVAFSLGTIVKADG